MVTVITLNSLIITKAVLHLGLVLMTVLCVHMCGVFGFVFAFCHALGIFY